MSGLVSDYAPIIGPGADEDTDASGLAGVTAQRKPQQAQQPMQQPAAAPAGPSGVLNNLPQNVLPGSVFNPATQQYQDRFGRLYDLQGNAVGSPNANPWAAGTYGQPRGAR